MLRVHSCSLTGKLVSIVCCCLIKLFDINIDERNSNKEREK